METYKSRINILEQTSEKEVVHVSGRISEETKIFYYLAILSYRQAVFKSDDGCFLPGYRAVNSGKLTNVLE
jgi:hypothetical protein